MTPNALTAIVPILPDRLEQLRSFLTDLGNNVANNPSIDFALSPSTHFARWVILDSADGIPARLFFSTCYDGDAEGYFQELSSNLGQGMEEVWTCCKGYAPGMAANPKQFAS